MVMCREWWPEVSISIIFSITEEIEGGKGDCLAGTQANTVLGNRELLWRMNT